MVRALFAVLVVVVGFGAAVPVGRAEGESPLTPTSAPASAPADDNHDIRVNAAGLFDVHLRDVPLPDALRLLSLRAARNISVADSVDSHVTADLYQVTLDDALEALLTPGGYVWFPRGKFMFVCKPEDRDRLMNANRPLEVRLFELHFVPAADVIPIVTKLLSPQGSVSSTATPAVQSVAPVPDDYNRALNAGLGGKSRAVGEIIVIRDCPDVLDEIANVIRQLDKRPRQVLIEAVILRARLNDSNALGIDFNALGGIDFRSVASTSVGVQNLTVGQVPEQKFDAPTGTVATNFAAAVPTGGLTFGLITNDVAMFVRALESAVDLTIVANPKILAVNEQPARIIVGRKDGYLTSTVTQTTTVQTVEYIETGTQILFRPFVGNDGFVRMDVHPEDSSGGLTAANLPFKDTTEVTTNVIVKDGHTLVIGGLFRDAITSTRNQLPWLGSVPLLGWLVSGTADQKVREEVIVLITPHIVDPDSAEPGQRLLDEVERWRVLSNRGLLPWGRQRLAQAHYQWALEHFRAGHTKRAEWDAQLALWLNPWFIEADHLREETAAQITEEPDISIIHDLVQQMLEEEVGTIADSTPPEEQP